MLIVDTKVALLDLLRESWHVKYLRLLLLGLSTDSLSLSNHYLRIDLHIALLSAMTSFNRSLSLLRWCL